MGGGGRGTNEECLSGMWWAERVSIYLCNNLQCPSAQEVTAMRNSVPVITSNLAK